MPPKSPIGKSTCGAGTISRSLAFSGLPILAPTKVDLFIILKGARALASARVLSYSSLYFPIASSVRASSPSPRAKPSEASRLCAKSPATSILPSDSLCGTLSSSRVRLIPSAEASRSSPSTSNRLFASGAFAARAALARDSRASFPTAWNSKRNLGWIGIEYLRDSS